MSVASSIFLLTGLPVNKKASNTARVNIMKSFTEAVARFSVDTEHERVLLIRRFFDGVVETSDELERVQRRHAIVMIGCKNQRGRVFFVLTLRRLDGVQRRVLEQVHEMGLLFRRSEIADPSRADGEFVKAKHVEHSDLSNCSAK